MSDHEQARFALAMAERELRALHGMRDPHVFAEEIFGFHAYMAVERALRARLLLAGVTAPGIRDLEQILALLEQQRISIPHELLPLFELNEFAAVFGDEPYEDLGDALDRAKCVQQVAALINYVHRQIRDAGPPLHTYSTPPSG